VSEKFPDLTYAHDTAFLLSSEDNHLSQLEACHMKCQRQSLHAHTGGISI